MSEESKCIDCGYEIKMLKNYVQDKRGAQCLNCFHAEQKKTRKYPEHFDAYFSNKMDEPFVPNKNTEEGLLKILALCKPIKCMAVSEHEEIVSELKNKQAKMRNWLLECAEEFKSTYKDGITGEITEFLKELDK